MSSPPTGTVAFLFTDIEGSTRMWEQDSEAMSEALACHDELLGDTIEGCGGYVFKIVGDAFCCTFPNAPDALGAALVAQRALLGQESEKTGPLRVRMALHMGAAEERDGDYFGPPSTAWRGSCPRPTGARCCSRSQPRSWCAISFLQARVSGTSESIV